MVLNRTARVFGGKRSEAVVTPEGQRGDALKVFHHFLSFPLAIVDFAKTIGAIFSTMSQDGRETGRSRSSSSKAFRGFRSLSVLVVDDNRVILVWFLSLGSNHISDAHLLTIVLFHYRST